ncbi:MAG: hypothetical protein PUD03_08615 [Lachnospiraceae bacterium]|nr:hypothetical protein [Lachnospiraceae bacterium]MDD5854133.1 hypothetical protein [Lachnospiraceae bacterium]
MKKLNKLMILVAMLIMTMGLTACEFHVSTGSSDEKKDEEVQEEVVEEEVKEEEEEPEKEIVEDVESTDVQDEEEEIDLDDVNDWQSLISELDTEYAKVAWTNVDSVFEENPGVVVSTVPGKEFGSDVLIVAITNLYEDGFCFSGTAKALAADGSVVGETYIYEGCVGSGNTIVEYIDCDSLPDGRIEWEDCDATETDQEFVPWEGEYEGNFSDDGEYLTIDYTVNATDGTACDEGPVTILLVDEDGNVIGVALDYMEEIEEDGSFSNSVDVYGDDGPIPDNSDVAFFANPIKK